MLNAFMKDHYFSIREATMKCIVDLKDTFGSERQKELIGSTIRTLQSDGNYVYRLTACTMLLQASECLDRKDFNELYQ